MTSSIFDVEIGVRARFKHVLCPLFSCVLCAGRQVCRFPEERREFPVVDVLASLAPLTQPELPTTEEGSLCVALKKGCNAFLVVVPAAIVR